MTERAQDPAQLTTTESGQGLKTPFKLSEGVYVVPGAKKAAICDTNSGNVYSINEAALNALTNVQDSPAFIQQLGEMGLYKPDLQLEDLEIKKGDPKLSFVWFEIIGEDCNESCVHCYAESMPPTFRKAAGLKDNPEYDIHNGSRDKLTDDNWCRLIEEAYELGAKQCQFIGGEPFLYVGDKKSRVLDLAQYAKSVGFETVEIFTNGTLITQRDIDKIKELGINIAVSLYSSDPEIHDSITNVPNSHKMTTKTLRRLKQADISTRIETVLMKNNQACSEQTMQFVEELGFKPHNPDVLRPKGRGDNLAIQPDEDYLVQHGLMLGPDFSASKQMFENYSSFHSCLAGKITITDKGDILPCIFSREQIVGNVKETGSLRKALEGPVLKDIWQTTKDDVLVCHDCEYRYVCFDCRPISMGSSNGFGEYKSAPYPRCTYNPYTGNWGNGTWKLDVIGQPFYDESLKEVIEKVRLVGVSGNQASSH